MKFNIHSTKENILLTCLGGACVLGMVLAVTMLSTLNAASPTLLTPSTANLSELEALPDHEFLPCLIRAARDKEGYRLVHEYPELLERFTGLYQYETGESNRFSLEEKWLTQICESTPDAWLRVTALYSGGMPELAADQCAFILDMESDPVWRELAWDGWLTMHLKSVDPSAQTVADWINAAVAEVSPSTLEHMLAQIIFRGPLHYSDQDSQEVKQLLYARMNARFIEDVLRALTPPAVTVNGIDVMQLYGTWHRLWSSTTVETLVDDWAVWLDALQQLPDGPFLAEGLSVLPETWYHWMTRTPGVFETLEITDETLNNLSAKPHYPRVEAHLEEGKAFLAVQAEDWNTSVAHHKYASEKLRMTDGMPWLDNARFWGKALENDAAHILTAVAQDKREDARVLLTEWLQQHPYGPVAWKMYEGYITKICSECMTPVFDPSSSAEIQLSLYPPEPSWTGEVLATSPFICGIPQIGLPRSNCPETTMVQLNQLAEGVNMPVMAQEKDVEVIKKELASALIQNDASAAVAGLQALMETDYQNDNGKQVSGAMTRALLSLKPEQRQELLQEQTAIPVNPRAMGMQAAMLCAQACDGTLSKEEALEQACSAQKEYLNFITEEATKYPDESVFQKAESIALAQMLLLADHSGHLNEDTAFLAERYIALGNPNPYAARMLWPMALREVRFALAAAEKALAKQWLARFEAITNAVQDAELNYPEEVAAETIAQRIHLLLDTTTVQQ